MREIRGGVFQGRFHNLLISKNNTFWAPQISRITFQVVYFTKQAWNVVSEYIRNFTQPGDLVLDPFGGSGVTAIEALMLGRRAIHIDLNPLSDFIVSSLVAPVNISELADEYRKIRNQFEKHRPATPEEIHACLQSYQYPKGIKLSKDADVETIEKLFSEKQLAQLALLKHFILEINNKNIRDSLLLAFSSSVNKFNLTFHYTKTVGGGDSSAFRYYRYRLAPEPGENDLMHIFETKVKKVIEAKKEIEPLINEKT